MRITHPVHSAHLFLYNRMWTRKIYLTSLRCNLRMVFLYSVCFLCITKATGQYRRLYPENKQTHLHSPTLIAQQKERRWGYVNEAGLFVIAPEYDSVSRFFEGKAVVKQKNQYDLIDETGVVLKSNIYPYSVSPYKPKVSGKKRTPYLSTRMADSRTASCPPNLDVEAGTFLNWETNTGRASVGIDESINVITQDQSPWRIGSGINGRQSLMDRNASPPTDKYGGFPVNPPNGGGRYAIKLGSDENDPNSTPPLPNALSESVRYKIDVPSNGNEYSILFSFAVVFENPNHPDNLHTFGQQPRFKAVMYEEGGDTLPCVNYTFVASDEFLEFDTSALYKLDSSNFQFPGGINFALVKYLPWTQVFVNLKPYRGKKLFLEFTTSDCTKRGHFGYAYVDVLECNYEISARNDCKQPGTTFLYGPDGPFQTYEWWDKSYSRLLGVGKNIQLQPGLPDNAEVHVRLIPYSRFGCIDTLTTKIKKIPINPIELGPDKFFCPGGSVSIGIPSQTGFQYQWSPATGLNATNVSRVTASPSSSTTYTLTVTDIATGCSASNQINLSLSSPPVISVNTVSICPQTSATLTASGADTYVWSPASTLSSNTGASVIATPITTTTYTVSGTSTATGCTSSAVTTVTLLPVPTASIESPGTRLICENGQTVLNAGSPQPGISYQWLFNGQPIMGATLSSILVTQRGEYSLQLFSAAGCKTLASGVVQLVNYRKPLVSIAAPAGCIRQSLSFQNRSDVSQSGVVNWEWRFGDGATSTLQNPVHTYTRSGFFTVVLVARSQTCSGLVDSMSIPVYIQEAISGIRYLTKQALINTSVQLEARNIGTSYTWFPATGLNNATIRNPVFRYDKEVEYLIRIATPSGCQFVDTILLRVNNEADVLVPTAFSPNGDGVNDVLDVFTLGIKKIHFWVFNRWGQLMFETTDPAQRWDGKYQGKPQPLENYVWIAEAETFSGKLIRKRGQTILIR